MKLVYEILTSPLGLPIPTVWEYFILLVVNEVVHEFAFYISPGGTFGSLIYWISKIICFFCVWFILYAICHIVIFITANIVNIIAIILFISMILISVALCY